MFASHFSLFSTMHKKTEQTIDQNDSEDDYGLGIVSPCHSRLCSLLFLGSHSPAAAAAAATAAQPRPFKGQGCWGGGGAWTFTATDPVLSPTPFALPTASSSQYGFVTTATTLLKSFPTPIYLINALDGEPVWNVSPLMWATRLLYISPLVNPLL